MSSSIALEATFDLAASLLCSNELRRLLDPDPGWNSGEEEIALTGITVKDESGLTSQYHATTYLSLIPKATFVVVFQII